MVSVWGLVLLELRLEVVLVALLPELSDKGTAGYCMNIRAYQYVYWILPSAKLARS